MRSSQDQIQDLINDVEDLSQLNNNNALAEKLAHEKNDVLLNIEVSKFLSDQLENFRQLLKKYNDHIKQENQFGKLSDIENEIINFIKNNETILPNINKLLSLFNNNQNSPKMKMICAAKALEVLNRLNTNRITSDQMRLEQIITEENKIKNENVQIDQEMKKIQLIISNSIENSNVENNTGIFSTFTAANDEELSYVGSTSIKSGAFESVGSDENDNNSENSQRSAVQDIKRNGRHYTIQSFAASSPFILLHKPNNSNQQHEEHVKANQTKQGPQI